jgi:hypothetical protein
LEYSPKDSATSALLEAAAGESSEWDRWWLDTEDVYEGMLASQSIGSNQPRPNVWTNPSRRSPFSMDATFLPRINSDVLGGDVQMTEVGATYVARWRYSDNLYFSARPFFNTLILDGVGNLFPLQSSNGPFLTDPGSLSMFGMGVDGFAAYRFNARWSMLGGAAVGIFSDFNDVAAAQDADCDPVLALARSSLMYRASDALTIVLGVMYAQVRSPSWLPSAGVIWTPSQRTRLELLFPRTRVFYRLTDRLGIYGIFQFANALYSIQRSYAAPAWFLYGLPTAYSYYNTYSYLEYEDYRLGIGLDWTAFGRVALNAEAGVALGRSINFSANSGENLDPSIYLRTGFRF